MLLGTYENQDVQGWVMSEKLDGVRGYWDGKTLLSSSRAVLTRTDLFYCSIFRLFSIDGEAF